VWDAADGEPLLSLSGHGDTILDVQFSFDGRTLATSSMDGTIRLWLASDELMDAAPLWEASGEGSGEGSGKDRGRARGSPENHASLGLLRVRRTPMMNEGL
jgi:hypothetical protein